MSKDNVIVTAVNKHIVCIKIRDHFIWENQQCDFRTGQTQTGLYKHRKELEA